MKFLFYSYLTIRAIITSISIILGTSHLSVKVPWPGSSERTFLLFKSNCHL